jgi:hypothetical protein
MISKQKTEPIAPHQAWARLHAGELNAREHEHIFECEREGFTACTRRVNDVSIRFSFLVECSISI